MRLIPTNKASTVTAMSGMVNLAGEIDESASDAFVYGMSDDVFLRQGVESTGGLEGVALNLLNG